MSPLKRHRALSVAGWLVALVVTIATFVVSGQNRLRNLSARVLGDNGGSEVAPGSALSSVEIFQKASPSVFVVEALGDDGESLDLGSGVAIASNLLITNCHVVQKGSSLRIRRAHKKWAARLVQALPNRDLCGLRPV